MRESDVTGFEGADELQLFHNPKAKHLLNAVLQGQIFQDVAYAKVGCYPNATRTIYVVDKTVRVLVIRKPIS